MIIIVMESILFLMLDGVMLEMFCQGMINLVGVVNIVIIFGFNDGVGLVGFIVIVVCSVSDSLVILLVCFNCSVLVYEVFKYSKYLVINMLCEDQQDLLNIFGGKVVMVDCFGQGYW